MKILDKYKKSIGHFIKFMIVGAVNFGVDYGILSLLSGVFGWPVAIANTISYSCGVTNSFFLNRYWTFKLNLKFFHTYAFKSGARIKFLSPHFLKFVFVNLISLGVNTLTMYILVDLYGLDTWNKLLAKVLATGFSFVVNFAGSKLLVFRENGVKAAAGEIK
jgi:putative flippase GtrA